MENVYFFTGFPGFIASQLIHTIAEKYKNATFLLLVHPTQVAKAAKELTNLFSHKAETRCRLIEGDITKDRLGLSSQELSQIEENVTHAFHLAAIYDLAVPKELAYQVNVEGTKHVTEVMRTALCYSILYILVRLTYRGIGKEE